MGPSRYLELTPVGSGDPRPTPSSRDDPSTVGSEVPPCPTRMLVVQITRFSRQFGIGESDASDHDRMGQLAGIVVYYTVCTSPTIRSEI